MNLSLRISAIATLGLVAACSNSPEADSPDNWRTTESRFTDPSAQPDTSIRSTLPKRGTPRGQVPQDTGQVTSSTASQLNEGVDMSFDQADSDGDRRLSQQEMAKDGVPVVITTWDSNEDGNLAGDEIYVIFFESLDSNGDGGIDAAELDKSARGWSGTKKPASKTSPMSQQGEMQSQQKAHQAFAKADKNRDQKIDQTEARVLADELGFFQAWDGDGDGKLSDSEITTHLYAAWDLDDDGYVDYAEWVTR